MATRVEGEFRRAVAAFEEIERLERLDYWLYAGANGAHWEREVEAARAAMEDAGERLMAERRSTAA